MKKTAILSMNLLLSVTQAYYHNVNHGFWGWCPVVADPPADGIKYPIYTLLSVPNDDGEINKLGSIECSDQNIVTAGQIDEDQFSPTYRQFIGYPGGQCAFVRDESACDMESIIDFLELYYCSIQNAACSTGKRYVMLPLAILLIIIAMWNLGSTADQYLSPALEAISDKFQCSESLAGVTLLALGNGAPDVFAAIAAGGDEKGLNLQVASLIGSSFFIVSFVMGLSLRAAPERKIQVTRNFFIRDAIFLIITCLYLLLILLVIKKITIIISLGFVFIYIIFVCVVLIQNKFFNKIEVGEEEIADQSTRAIEYSNLIAFKRQELKKGTNLNDEDGASGSMHSKRTASIIPDTLKSIYSKKLPKNVLQIDDKLGQKYLSTQKQQTLRKQNTQGLLGADLDEMTMKLNDGTRGQSNSMLNHDKNASLYQKQDIIQVQQITSKKDEMIRYQSTYNMDKKNHGTNLNINDEDIDMDPESMGLNQSSAKEGNHLALDNNISAYRQQKQGSVQVVSSVLGPNVMQEHVRRTELLENQNENQNQNEGQARVEQNYAAQKLMIQFKRTGDSDESKLDKCWKVVEVPLNFLRDFSIPMADFDDWDRFRASVLPLTIPTAFMFTQQWLNSEDSSMKRLCLIVGLALAAPGLICSIYLCFCTKKTVAPPRIMFAMAILGFVMSISWIAFTSNFVIDLLWIIGLILSIPKSLLGLTLLAVGNCLGDMNANVAMTKKGFGEMAVTASLAGPVFNVLFGLGVSISLSLLSSDDPTDGVAPSFRWSIWDRRTGDFDKSSAIPLALLIAMPIVLILILMNGITSNYFLSFKFHGISLVFYSCVTVGLCIFAIAAGVQ